MSINLIRIATRRSKLALWQAEHVKHLLLKHYPHLTIELVDMTTRGDTEQTQALSDIGGKSLFVKELQQALLDDTADMAVHSLKDLSVYEHPDLVIAAILKRAEAADVVCSNTCSSLDALAAGSIIGTSSPRRHALIKHLYPQLEIHLLRGNVDTRIKQLDAGQYDAVILAAAGLIRLGLSARIQSYLPKAIFVPAIGQGAIAIECLKTQDELHTLLAPLHNEATARCVRAERAVNKKLNGDCFTPIGAYAELIDGDLYLNAFVSSKDGRVILRAQQHGLSTEPEALGLRVAEELLAQGALTLL